LFFNQTPDINFYNLPRIFNQANYSILLLCTDVTGMISVDSDAGMVNPGKSANIHFELFKPVGLENGIRFAIREGGITIGAGLVTEVVDK